MIYVKNSDEEDQTMTFKIKEVTSSEIKVQLTFEQPILVS